MGSWSLEAFIGEEVGQLDVDKIARDCVARTGDYSASLSDDLCPFDESKLGVRIDWPGWHVLIMVRDDPSVIDDALHLSKSRTPPAATRSRLPECKQSVRVIFGSDEAKQFTNHIINISDFLMELSSDRVYDSTQKKFW